MNKLWKTKKRWKIISLNMNTKKYKPNINIISCDYNLINYYVNIILYLETHNTFLSSTFTLGRRMMIWKIYLFYNNVYLIYLFNYLFLFFFSGDTFCDSKLCSKIAFNNFIDLKYGRRWYFEDSFFSFLNCFY